MVLANHEAGVVIEEKDLTGELLCKTVKELTDSPEKLKELSENAKALAITDANERIKKEILDLYER
jgi:UDP-N-acetylglucosamine--N-acetylmuramyl-(pentapeptide) pyrophosphoryl-undecaprenol N-acetylglucosamine transferase